MRKKHCTTGLKKHNLPPEQVQIRSEVWGMFHGRLNQFIYGPVARLGNLAVQPIAEFTADQNRQYDNSRIHSALTIRSAINIFPAKVWM
jgi:hypothetical protein